MVDIIVMSGKPIKVDFLYLDLNTCDRCMDTENTLDEAIDELSTPLKSLGYNFVVNKVTINNIEMAKAYNFISSPTIRVNGYDILGDIEENTCGACSTLSGSTTSCRVFYYAGKMYNNPPKAMIIDGILKILYGPHVQPPDEVSYVIPDNLVTFFEAVTNEKSRCCGEEVKV